jgi:sortase A
MKKLISIFIAIIMFMSMSIPALAHNYQFSSGANNSDVFGKSTSTDALVSHDPLTDNTRRNKDAAYNPPPFGVGSGNIPTDQSSPYHENSRRQSGGTGGNFSMGVSYTPINTGGSVSPMSVSYAPINNSGSPPPPTAGANHDYSSMLPPTSVFSFDTLNIEPLYYEDGSIGTLHFPKLNLTVKVYEGETLENMRIGVGHFEFTSAWDGNVAIAGHNRGVPDAIGGIKNFVNGDRIIYTTRYGVRTYEMFNKQQISDTDYSLLGWSDTNILTLITCVENVPSMRLAVQFREIK